MLNKTPHFYHRIVAISASIAMAVYCVGTLFYVATSFDLGVRCLLTNSDRLKPGVEIRQVSSFAQKSSATQLPEIFGEAPQAGDLLVTIGDQPIRSFVDYSKALASLRSALPHTQSAASRVQDENPLDVDRDVSLPPVINYFSSQPAPSAFPNGTAERSELYGRYVRVKFEQASTGELKKSWLQVQPLPAVEVILSMVWCLLEYAILLVAAISFCNRPRDPASRLFFWLCVATLPAFVGGYHWWVIASNLWLTIPFVISAVLLPVITLHFYLNYPSRNRVLLLFPRISLVAMYLPAVMMLGGLMVLLGLVWVIPFPSTTGESQRILLLAIRLTVDVYIVIAFGYFTLSVASMIESYRRCKQVAERKQLQWILVAAGAATPLVIYAVYLAYEDRVGLALGRGRVPMVGVSLLFLTAYAIGIMRYRLMLIDQMISRHTLYVVLSQTVTLIYSVAIAVGSLLTVYWGITDPQQLLPFAIILTAGILALSWLRDNTQMAIDRRFFREKYRLDRAMHQMNLIVAKVADVRSLAEQMLRSCREVLQVRFSALYLRDGRSNHFDLVASVGGGSLAVRIQLDPESEKILQESGSHQRISGTSKQGITLLQQLHRDLNSQLVHGFEVDGKLSGVVVLGAKSSASPFTAEDTTFVTAIGQMTGVALQCVRIQQNVSRLDGMLQEKVRKIESQERQIAILQNQLIAETAPPTSALPASEAEEFAMGKIRGSSPALQQVINSARKVARSDSSVLVRGESGTGKELLAQAIHHNSKRKNGPLVCVNCAALSPALLESELFGHVKGAFTGAYRDAVGRFQMADSGTLFLDEIGDVSLEVQVKLLRVLQERRFEPVGSRESVSVDVRLIAATHQNLEQLMREGKFREDLYYRLNVITLRLPALRERKEDLFELSLSFLHEAAATAGKQIRDIDDLAFRALLNYDWPGNIRELHNAIQRAVLLAETDVVLLENLPQEVQQAVFKDSQPAPSTPTFHKSRRLAGAARLSTETGASSKNSTGVAALESGRISFRQTSGQDEEKQVLLEVLQSCAGNKAEAARKLGMPRSTFYSKLKKYDL